MAMAVFMGGALKPFGYFPFLFYSICSYLFSAYPYNFTMI